MKSFSLEGFAAELVRISVGGKVLTDSMLDYVGERVQKSAKDKIGHDENAAAGPFAAWDALAQKTIEEKEYLGFVDRVSPNDSLLRTGEMRNSIEYTLGHQQVEIGSNDPTAEYQELGTQHIPARSFLGGAAFEQAPGIVERLGVAMVGHLEGSDPARKIKIE